MRCGVLHRLVFVTFAAAILYGGGSALASEAATAPAESPPPLAAPGPLAPDGSVPAPAKAAPAQRSGRTPQAPDGPGEAHIALLLPLESPSFARHAEAVKNGFLAAAKVQGSTPLPLRIYAVNDDDRSVVEQYQRALEHGARFIVGPLTRSGVSALAESALVMVPTIALNVPERRISRQSNLYMLSLHAEAEAQQAAQFAYQEGRQNAIVVYGETPLLKRLHQAFAQEFRRLGGKLLAEYAFAADQSELARIRRAVATGSADMAFLALDFPRARLARPYLGALPLYATSHVYPGNTSPLAGFDLANVRFLDMPWLLQPEHPAVMVYPRQDHRDADLDRFYALGIDAFRVAREILAGTGDVALDGVSGRLRLGSDLRFERGLTAAQFSDGKLKIFSEAR
jgi:outer membrane PBP1 activator LpoA protein